MYEENNNPVAISEDNPDGLDKTKRIVEFYPQGTTDYTLYEDDGMTANSTITEDDDYGTINSINYGDHVETHFTSAVNGDKAVLTAEASQGYIRRLRFQPPDQVCCERIQEADIRSDQRCGRK